MPKDDDTISYIEEFNRSHRRIKREEKDWYVMYLPRGLGMEDITEKEDRQLMAIFTKAEEEMQMEFDLMVRDRFVGYFESLSLGDILEYLPQKPIIINLETMKREDRNAIKDIYTEGIENGYIKKTLRKQIRKYLDDAGYLKKSEMEILVESEPEERKARKTAERKAIIKREPEQVNVEEFLPHKPVAVPFESLTEEDREAIITICSSGLEAGYVKKTIRKQVRKIIDAHGYLNDETSATKEEPAPAEQKKPKAKKTEKKAEKAAPKANVKADKKKPEPKKAQKVEKKAGKTAPKAEVKAEEKKPEPKKAQKVAKKAEKKAGKAAPKAEVKAKEKKPEPKKAQKAAKKAEKKAQKAAPKAEVKAKEKKPEPKKAKKVAKKADKKAQKAAPKAEVKAAPKKTAASSSKKPKKDEKKSGAAGKK